MLRIGLDVHGVLDKYTSFFLMILPLIRKASHVEICILTGPPLLDASREVKKLSFEKGKHYDSLYSVVDYLQITETKMWQDDKGRWWASEEDWWSSKAKMCKYHKVDFLIDDSEEYAPYFTDKSIFVNIKNLLKKKAARKPRKKNVKENQKLTE